MKLYKLTAEQEQVFAERMRQVGSNLLQVTFADPEKDQAAIRYHASQMGKFELLKEILEDNFPDPEAPTSGESDFNG